MEALLSNKLFLVAMMSIGVLIYFIISKICDTIGGMYIAKKEAGIQKYVIDSPEKLDKVIQELKNHYMEAERRNNNE